MPDVPTVRLDDLPPSATLLDVREDDEWAAGHVEGALHIPMNQLPNRIAYQPDSLGPDRPVFVLCKMGGRSGQVTAWLNRQGYDARNVDGGMLAWAAARRPMISETGRPPEVI